MYEIFQVVESRSGLNKVTPARKTRMIPLSTSFFCRYSSYHLYFNFLILSCSNEFLLDSLDVVRKPYFSYNGVKNKLLCILLSFFKGASSPESFNIVSQIL